MKEKIYNSDNLKDEEIGEELIHYLEYEHKIPRKSNYHTIVIYY